MGAGVAHTRVQSNVRYVTSAGTKILRLTGRSVDRTLQPVIVLYGWTGDDSAEEYLDRQYDPMDNPFFQDRGAIDALLYAGFSCYSPFTGSNWGTNTTSPSGLGGTGLAAIDAALDVASADGLPVTAPHFFETSAGGCNSLNWAWRNPTAVGKLYLMSPGFDLDYLYDQEATVTGWGLPSVQTSLRGCHGGTDKPSWVTASANYDPARNTASLTGIGANISIYSARDDEVVPWSDLVTFSSTIGATLLASTGVGVAGGGHLVAPSKAAWDDRFPVQWFSS
jgi:pimeloyl-ACP methyl ester carboxylesterase